MRRLRALGAIAFAIGAAPALVSAQQARATVVRVDGEEIFVDLPRELARPDLVLEVYRELEVRHPITRRTIRDRFLIGRLAIVTPGEHLSIAREEGAMLRPVEVGDAVEAPAPPSPSTPAPDPLGPAQAPPAPPERVPPPSSTVRSADPPAGPDEAELLLAFRSTLGRAPDARLAVWQHWLERNPTSRYRPAVVGEVVALRTLDRLVARERDPGQRLEAMQRAVVAEPLRTAAAGEDRAVAVGILPRASIRALRLHHRARGERGYTTIPMAIEGGHARAVIPGASIRAPGLEYFVEAFDREGHRATVIGSSEAPRRVAVAVPGAASDGPRARVRVSGEYVGFDTFTPAPGRDFYFLGESDVLYRILWEIVYGVRLGYGALQGSGRSVADLEAGLPTLPAGFTYGYLEIEIRITELFGAIVRGTVGLGQPNEAGIQTDGVRGGAQLRLRIGPERGTHLVLAGELSSEIGQRAFVGLSWEIAEGFPTSAEVHVTDQPVGSDIGVRIVLEQGLRVAPWMTVSLRLGYQGRRITHTGLGGGAAFTFDW